LIAYLHDSNNLRRLCGWESKGAIPSESTFSRAFEEFSHGGLGEKIHEAMVKQHAGAKLAGHVSRDATEIDAREKPLRKEAKSPQSKSKRKRGLLQEKARKYSWFKKFQFGTREKSCYSNADRYCRFFLPQSLSALSKGDSR
jgi:hypothetical protein